jgi:hypothetical protein
MMKRIGWQRTFCAAIVCVGFAGCAAQTESRAIAQANAEARTDGYDLRRYEARARYNLTGDGMWTVFYTARPDASGGVTVGDHFSVTVDRAGNGTLVPGR